MKISIRIIFVVLLMLVPFVLFQMEKPASYITDGINVALPKLNNNCLVQYLGCICKKENIPLFKTDGVSKQFDVSQQQQQQQQQQCYLWCYERNTILAAINGQECVCGDAFLEYYPIITSNKCKRKSIEYVEDSCFEEDSYEVYYFLRSCSGNERNMTENDVLDHFVGNFVKPINFTKQTFFALRHPGMTSSYCYRHCENHEQKLAMLSDDKTCRCGHTTEDFSLSNPLPDSADNFLRQALHRSEPSVSVWITDAPDYRCISRKFLPAGEHHEPVGLASCPGSGNTWLRHLIECATGYYSGSVYHDVTLQASGFLGEYDPYEGKRTVIIKDHSGYFTSKFCRKIVLLIRNPYEAIVAEFNRKYAKSHIGVRDSKDFHSKEWEKSVIKQGKKWMHWNSNLLSDKRIQVHVVYFDDLVEDHITVITNVIEFLGRKVDKTRLLCLKHSGTGLFKRKKAKKIFNPYSPKQISNLNNKIRSLRNMLEEHNLHPLPSYER